MSQSRAASLNPQDPADRPWCSRGQQRKDSRPGADKRGPGLPSPLHPACWATLGGWLNSSVLQPGFLHNRTEQPGGVLSGRNEGRTCGWPAPAWESHRHRSSRRSVTSLRSWLLASPGGTASAQGTQPLRSLAPPTAQPWPSAQRRSCSSSEGTEGLGDGGPAGK